MGSNFSLDNNVYFIPFTNEDLDLAKLYVDSNLVTKETYEFKVIGIYTQNETDEVPELSNEILFLKHLLNLLVTSILTMLIMLIKKYIKMNHGGMR